MKRFANRAGARNLPIVRSLLLSLASLLLIAAVISACGDDPAVPDGPAAIGGSSAGSAAPAPSATATATLPPTDTPPPPTPTPQLAAMVNGQPILLEMFEQEVARYEAAQAELGFTPGADGQDYQRLVLEALIERELISQAASTAGISISQEMVDARVSDIQQAPRESGSFEEWLALNRWTLESFKETLAVEMLVERMVAYVTTEVPYTAEQVRASYIQVDDQAEAESLLAQIKEGADFGDLAARYSRDRITAPAGGDLGFFTRGSLLVPEVEEVAYQLQPGDISELLSVADPQSGQVTHYIIKVTDRVPDRPLNTAVRQQLLEARFNEWLAELRAGATIIYLLNGQ